MSYYILQRIDQLHLLFFLFIIIYNNKYIKKYNGSNSDKDESFEADKMTMNKKINWPKGEEHWSPFGNDVIDVDNCFFFFNRSVDVQNRNTSTAAVVRKYLGKGER